MDMILSMKKSVVEFVGTFALLFIGVLVIHSAVTLGNGDLTTVALAHGLTIAALVSATMTISGGQLNPAVTLGLFVGGKIGWMQAVANVVAQVLGALAGGYLALAALGGDTGHVATATPDLGEGVSVVQGILIEAVLTFLLVFVVYGTGVDPRFGARIGGLAIGLTVALGIMAGGPLTGAAINPARWIGSSVPGLHFANGVVYLVGPLLGAAVAGVLWGYYLLKGPRPFPEPQAHLRARGNR